MDNLNSNKNIKSWVKKIILKYLGYIVPILQYVPNTSIWFGIMSLPLIGYLVFFFMNPIIAWMDFLFFILAPELYIAIAGMILFIYSLVYILKHRKVGLVTSGPYKYMRHPQYFGIIIATLSLTIMCFRTSPITPIDGGFMGYTFLVFIWIVEFFLYLLLAKLEDLSLKSRYKLEFKEYSKKVPFMIPFLNHLPSYKKESIK